MADTIKLHRYVVNTAERSIVNFDDETLTAIGRDIIGTSDEFSTRRIMTAVELRAFFAKGGSIHTSVSIYSLATK